MENSRLASHNMFHQSKAASLHHLALLNHLQNMNTQRIPTNHYSQSSVFTPNLIDIPVLCKNGQTEQSKDTSVELQIQTTLNSLTLASDKDPLLSVQKPGITVTDPNNRTIESVEGNSGPNSQAHVNGNFMHNQNQKVCLHTLDILINEKIWIETDGLYNSSGKKVHR